MTVVTAFALYLLTALPVYGVWVLVALLGLLVARPWLHWLHKYQQAASTCDQFDEMYTSATVARAKAEQAVVILERRLAEAQRQLTERDDICPHGHAAWVDCWSCEAERARLWGPTT